MSYELLSDRTYKAKKEHRCIWCGEKILIGETYEYVVGVFYGELQDNHWHPECRAVSSKWFQESGEDEFDPYENDRAPKNASILLPLQ